MSHKEGEDDINGYVESKPPPIINFRWKLGNWCEHDNDCSDLDKDGDTNNDGEDKERQ